MQQEKNDKMETPVDTKFVVSVSPHLYNRETTKNIMWLVVLSLLPATIYGVIAFGIHSLYVVVSSVVTAILAEYIIVKLRGKKNTISDGSAVLTGLLLALNMPPSVPLYVPIISTIFGIAIVKHAFGGLGENWANPAIAARVFALFAWSKKMTIWNAPFTYDATTVATPLGALKSAIMQTQGTDLTTKTVNSSSSFFSSLQIFRDAIGNQDISYLDLFFGFKGGCIGEISVFLLLIGALYLIHRKIVTLDIPISFIFTSAIIAWIFGGVQFGYGYFKGDVLFHILTGGLVLGAFFMATDMVTTPITGKGRIAFGIGCGIITMLVRLLGGLPEGVSLSILFMNMMTPIIDKIFVRKPLGYVKPKK